MDMSDPRYDAIAIVILLAVSALLGVGLGELMWRLGH